MDFSFSITDFVSWACLYLTYAIWPDPRGKDNGLDLGQHLFISAEALPSYPLPSPPVMHQPTSLPVRSLPNPPANSLVLNAMASVFQNLFIRAKKTDPEFLSLPKMGLLS